MNRRTLLTTGVAALSGCAGALETGPELDPRKLEESVREGTMEARNDEGLGLLATDETLREIARYHAEDMIEESYIGNVSPSGETFADRYAKFDFTCSGRPPEAGGTRVGNNVLGRFRFERGKHTAPELADKLLGLWRKQTEKYKILTSGFWDATGVGAAADGDGGETVVYVAVYFC
jgi:uncharacterized protein YkwD